MVVAGYPSWHFFQPSRFVRNPNRHFPIPQHTGNPTETSHSSSDNSCVAIFLAITPQPCRTSDPPAEPHFLHMRVSSEKSMDNLATTSYPLLHHSGQRRRIRLTSFSHHLINLTIRSISIPGISYPLRYTDRHSLFHSVNIFTGTFLISPQFP